MRIQYRIMYMDRGSGHYTGISYTKPLDALRRFEAYTKAWLQQSADGGRTWETL